PGVPRVIGRVGDPGEGPVLVAVGGIHGNEPAGVLALQRVVANLSAGGRPLRGHLLALAGNCQALALDRRYVLDDLNRAWLPERLARVRAGAALADEDAELRDLDAVLRQVLSAAPGRVTVLDLHSTSGQGGVFTTLDDTLANRALASR